MRDKKGQFIKGVHSHMETEFKVGQHWRPRKPHWDKEWLFTEYVSKGRSASNIALQESCTEANILFWLHRYNIPCRSIREVRSLKYWGQRGSTNPMWKGGTSSERDTLTNSLDWAWAIRKIYARDNKTCQRCGRKQSKSYKQFHIHHRITFAEKDLRLNIDNLVLLCVECHRWVHSKRNETKSFMGNFQISMKGGDNATVL